MRNQVRAAWGVTGLVALLVGGAPAPALAAFNCEQSVEYQAAWCASSQITSIQAAEATKACAAFSGRLAAQCRPDWDRFTSCREFAKRFEDLLQAACLSHVTARKHCQSWSAAFAQGPQRRCERGRFTF